MNNSSLGESLKKFFGFNTFKGNQEAVIKSLLDGNDTFVIMPTGGGKSLCYQLPALMSKGTAIIVSPLIALMKNQVDSMRGFSTENGVAHVLNSSLTKREIQQVKDDITNGITKMLYVAPESLTKEENIDFLKSVTISFYAIDEAHCISEWGHDFRPEYRNLRSIMTKIGKKPIIALTATATPKVQSDIQKNLGMENALVFKSSFNRENLYYEIRPKVNTEKEIIKFIKNNIGKSGIIYCMSRKKVEELAQTLQVNGIKALPYHAGLDSNTRARHQDAFLMEEIDVIVATIAFGMGIDKPDVRFVIHYDMPKSLESYYQETGRAGRDGGEGNCIAFYAYQDLEKMEKLMAGKPVAELEIGKQLIAETIAYAETSGCRRRYLLKYFGEEFSEENCNNMCDNCRNPKEKFDAQDDVKLVLETVLSGQNRFKAAQIVAILKGNLNQQLRSYKVDEYEQFNEGADKSEHYWNSVIRQCIVNGLLEKEIETYGILKITPEGRNFIMYPQPFMMAEDTNFQGITDDDDDVILAGKSGAAFDEVLFKMLKDVTKAEAKKKGIPPYAVFQESALNEMALHYPTTLEELKNIPGVGEGKAKKFGQPFVDLIAKYVKENNIEKPEDFVMKSVVNKSSLKVFIIQSTDRKVALDDIAKAKGLTMDELLDEIEAIVNSGTRININYYLEKKLDEDQIEEIFDYFMESETDSIQEACNEFRGEFSEEEIRMVRIKFMSEVAN